MTSPFDIPIDLSQPGGGFLTLARAADPA